MQNYLAHHGIKDQKWYVRRFQNEDGSLTPAGKERYGEWQPGKRKKTTLKEVRNKDGSYRYNIESEDGSKVGNISTYHQSDDSLRVSWISVDKNHKREGYASGAMDTLFNQAREKGYKKVTVVVPKDDTNVQHIYERLGFKPSNDGLTNDEVADSITSLGEVVKMEYELEHSDTLDDVLDDFLSHSAKGTVWKDHKYIKKENGRYYYADDNKISKTSSDELMDEIDAIQQQMAFCDQKAKEYDELAKSNPDEAAEYKAQAKKYRDEIERLNGEREQIAKGLKKKNSYDEQVNDFRNEPILDTLNKYKKNIYLGNPKIKLKHSEDVLDDFLMHYGVGPDDNPPGRGSGRYPKGSGERPYQHDENKDVGEKKKGLFAALVRLGNKIPQPKSINEAAEEAGRELKEQEARAKHLIQTVRLNTDPRNAWDTKALSKTQEIKELAENENIKAARKAYEEADSEYTNYAKDEKTREYYERMAANVRYKLDDYETNYPNQSVEGMEDWYVYDDGDQGDFNSFQCYLIDHNVDLKDYAKKTFDAHVNYDNVRLREVKETMGRLGNEKVDKDGWRTYADVISDAVEEHQDSQSMFYFGWFDSDYSHHVPERMDEAKKVMEEYKKSHPLKHSDDLLDDFLAHYGVGPDDNPPGRGSGRYAKGTGANPYQHDDTMRAQKKRGLFGSIQTALAKRKANTEIDKYRDYVDGMLKGSLKNNKALQDKYKELNERTDGKEFDRGPFRYQYNIPDELSGKEIDREKLAAEWKKFSEEVVDKHAKAEARSETLKKARETKAANKAKAEEEKKTKEEREAEKAKAIASGDPEQISKWLSKMSNQEQVDAINRIKNTQDIKDRAAAQVKAREDAAKAEEARRKAEEEANRPKTKKELRAEKLEAGFEKAKDVMNKVDDVRQMAEKGIKFWNVLAAVNNATNPDFKLPKVDLNSGEKKKDKDKEENKENKDNKNQNKNQQNNSGSTTNTNSNNTTYNTTNNYYNGEKKEETKSESETEAETWRPSGMEDWYDAPYKYEEAGKLLLEDFMKRKK